MATLPPPPLREEEYLSLERSAESKSEFHDGQMFAMAGGSLNHSLLANSLGAILRSQVSPECRVFNADLRLHVIPAKMYTYAECSVICGEPQFAGDQRDCVVNPLLIAEVLSPSTEGYDRGKKFELYRTLSSLREYLLIHQDRAHLEHYAKQLDGSWLLRECSGLEASLSVGSLSVQILLSDLYALTHVT